MLTPFERRSSLRLKLPAGCHLQHANRFGQDALDVSLQPLFGVQALTVAKSSEVL